MHSLILPPRPLTGKFNHNFFIFSDFGLETLAERVSETKFPWLMSNVIDNETGRPLGDGKITHVMDWNGKRIGLVRLFCHFLSKLGFSPDHQFYHRMQIFSSSLE